MTDRLIILFCKTEICFPFAFISLVFAISLENIFVALNVLNSTQNLLLKYETKKKKKKKKN